ncbi:hypothetical protein VP01_2708g2, partial [Puccinia sorghi]
QSLGLTPKKFLLFFLQQTHPEVIYRRRFRGPQSGHRSTMKLVQELQNEMNKTTDGGVIWAAFTQQEIS